MIDHTENIVLVTSSFKLKMALISIKIATYRHATWKRFLEKKTLLSLLIIITCHPKLN